MVATRPSGGSHAGKMPRAAVLDCGSNFRTFFFVSFGLLKPCINGIHHKFFFQGGDASYLVDHRRLRY